MLFPHIYRKVQEFGLTVQYGTDENFSILIRHILALAFLPYGDIPAAFDELWTIIPEEANRIMEWFEIYYIRDRVRYTTRGERARRSKPLFSPKFWSITDNLEYALPCTQNSVKAWHRRWEILVSTHWVVHTLACSKS